MNTYKITFSNQKGSDFIKELRKVVKVYFEESNKSKFGNANMIVKTIFMFSIYLIPYFLMITGIITHPAFLFFLWIIMGFGMAGIELSVMHDANHRSYSKNQRINKILSYSLNLLGGFSYTWQYQHNTLHHGFTNIDGYDEDIDPGKILRFSPYKPL
ncbi:fatty acid desaturase family protein [Bacteroidota bacterium]